MEELELELERAELLQNRETSCRGGSYHPGSSVTQLCYGNTAQSGMVNVSVANGSFDNILSFGSGNIL